MTASRDLSPEFPALLSRMMSREPVGLGDVRAAFDAILSGSWTPVQVAAFAVVLRTRGETEEHIVGAVQAMRAVMTPVDHGLALVADTCGTGGDGSQSLNLSSMAAVIVAACGVPVAKHGNRSASSRCGSADVFEALGIPLDLAPEHHAELLRQVNITFLFAPAHHPALRHVAKVRSELGARTIFNALGPLANPARASHQLIGVYDDGLRSIAAHALHALGTRRAWVVRSEDGLDEVSPSAPTRVSELDEGGSVREFVVTPEDFGLSRVPQTTISGGDASFNARALRTLVDGGDHPVRDAALLNAAAALAVATGDDWRACAERARRALDDGAARETLDAWRRVAAGARPA